MESEHAVVPGTRMAVDWPKLVSGQDILTATPPPDPSSALLLGNGDVGVALYGPPECLTLQVGKNDIWDYRDPMDEKRPVSHQEFLREYADPSRPPMEKYLGPNGPDPRNEAVRWACHSPTPSAKTAGQIRLRNRALAEASYAARLRLWDAELTAELGTPQSTRVRTFVSYPRNLVVVEYTPERPCELDVELARNHDSAGLIPNGPELGAAGRDLWVRYRFPPDPATYPDGFEYVMYGRVIGGEEVRAEVQLEVGKVPQWVCWHGNTEAVEDQAVAHVRAAGTVTLLVAVATTRDDRDPMARARREVDEAAQLYGTDPDSLVAEHRRAWHDYWRRSFVQVDRPFLVRQWFFSQYLLACCCRAGRICPGLFGPWVWEDFTGWGNDYHWDYNMQQLVWAAYSSNHLEQTVTYNEAALALLPAAMTDARETYGLDGAKFFLTSYPRTYAHNSFPLLHYDKMMSMNGWVAHPMWWYYLYSQDTRYLESQAYPLIRECASFYEGYLTAAPDGKYDIWPTAVWDVPFSPHLKQNRNCHMDLAFIRCLMKAVVAASEVLGVDADRRARWRRIAENLREYPTTDTPDGEVFVNFEGIGVTKFGLPIATIGIFPGDDIGLHSPERPREVARRTASALPYTNDGDVVLTGMAKIRLGSDELEAIERHTREVLLPNRGLWVRNWRRIVWVHGAGWPILINESVLQSYTGRLRVAPVKLDGSARFGRLRAVGAFLVSGEIRPGGEVAYLAITSEAGGACALVRPWDGPVRVRELASMAPVPLDEGDDVASFETRPGSTYVVDRPSDPWEQQPIQVISAADAPLDPMA